MITERNIPTRESTIEEMIADWTKALCGKDVDAMMKQYDPKVIVFDLKPPFQTTGVAAWRKMWTDCLP